MKKILFCLLFCLFCLGCSNNSSINNNEEDNDSLIKIADLCKEARETKNLPKALKLASQIIELNKNSSIGYCELALTYSAMGKLDKATEAITKALELNPEDEMAQIAKEKIESNKDYSAGIIETANACKKERKVNNFQEALKLANQIIEMDSNNSIGYCELALTYYEMGDIDKAKEAIEKALEINPDDEVAQKAKESIMKN